jgi:hypothetical protein
MNLDRLVIIARSIDVGHSSNFRHIAFILKGSRVRSIGWNKKKTHTRSNRYPYVGNGWNDIYAELDASIRYGKTDCTGHIMVVIRIRSNGKLGLSKPCPGCEFLVKQLNFRKVYYSTENQDFEELTLS